MNCQSIGLSNLIVIIFLFPQILSYVRRQDAESQNRLDEDGDPPTKEFKMVDLTKDVIEWKDVWPNGIIYYEISPEFNETSHELIHGAMKEISSKTCIKFKKHTSEPDFIYFRQQFGDGCHTHAGKKGGLQILNLDPQRCIQHGKIMHELMHVAGFHHEHQRPDRDYYVDIYWDNIKPDDWVQMQIFGAKKNYLQDFPYDYGSILHYGNESFYLSVDRSKPILGSKHWAPEMGQRKFLSDIDIQKINFLYNCDKRTST